ncbi:hypothetical protein Agub_g7822, partial [Astrephomene gubernaculifera]
MFLSKLHGSPWARWQGLPKRSMLSTPLIARPTAPHAAASDAPDTSYRPGPKRVPSGRRQRTRKPMQRRAPPPEEREAPDNMFMDPGRFNIQEQMEIMQQLISRMTDEERQEFMQFIAEQETQAEGEAFAQLTPEQQQQAMYESSFEAFQEQLNAGLWSAILDNMPDGDAELLRKFLPPGWYGHANNLTRSQVAAGMARLSRAEQRRLPNAITQATALQDSFFTAAVAHDKYNRISAQRRKRMAAQKGLTISEPDPDANHVFSMADEDDVDPDDASGDNDQENISTSQRPVTDISDLLSRVRQRLEREDLQQQEQQGGLDSPAADAEKEEEEDAYAYADRRQQPGASTSGCSSSNSDRRRYGSSSRSSSSSRRGDNSNGDIEEAEEEEQEQELPIPAVLRERLGKMKEAYDIYVAGGGWQREMEQRHSSEMRNLIRLHEELTELATAAARLAALTGAPHTTANNNGSSAASSGGSSEGSRDVLMYDRSARVLAAEVEQRGEELAGQVAALLEPGT